MIIHRVDGKLREWIEPSVQAECDVIRLALTGLTDLLLMINAELQVAAGRTVAGTELEISSSCLPVFHTITPPFSPENILRLVSRW